MSRVARWSPGLIATSVALCMAASSPAQMTPAPPQLAPPDTARMVLEQVVEDRWIHAGQDRNFVPFLTDRRSIHLHPSPEPGRVTSHVFDLRAGRVEATLGLDPDNGTNFLVIHLPPTRPAPASDPREGAAARRQRLAQRDRVPWSLPSAVFWEVPFVVGEEPLVRGLSWVDTLRYSAEPGDGLSEDLEGVWRKRVIGDTALLGRRLPVVTFDAEVRYVSMEVHDDPVLGTPVRVARNMSGTMTGRAVVDTARGVRAGGADTTRWTGTAVLVTGDGRDHTSPVRYEGRRTWLLRDREAWAASQDSSVAALGTSMLVLPRTAVEERLYRGDEEVADSLFRRFSATRDPDERRTIERMLLRWWVSEDRPPGPVEARLVNARLLLGDSAGVLESDLERLGTPGHLTSERLDRLLPYLRDAGRLWRLGIEPGPAHARLASLLLEASPILQPDTSTWGCEPAACRRVLEVVGTADEPRLRDAALVGAFARDPARWYDRLRARADSGSIVARDALLLGSGIAIAGRSGENLEVPGPGADWRRWLAWLSGGVRWSDSHGYALRLYAARSGRDPVEELLDRWPPPQDSARLVLGHVLREMGALPHPTPEELAETMRTGSEVDRRRAVRTVEALMAGSGTPAPVELVAELMGPLLDSLVVPGSRPWPALPPPGLPAGAETSEAREPELRGAPTGFHDAPEGAVFLLEENLPPGTAADPPGDLRPIGRAAWRARPLREGGSLLELEPVRTLGPFAAVEWNWTVLRSREPDEPPGGYAGGGSVLLLRTEQGWRVVLALVRIT